MVLSQCDATHRKWVAEKYDCDDFAYVLKAEFSTGSYQAANLLYGFAVGIISANFAQDRG